MIVNVKDFTLWEHKRAVIRTFDISGRQLKSFSIDANVFVVKMEENGVYIFLTTDAEGVTQADKVVVVR